MSALFSLWLVAASVTVPVGTVVGVRDLSARTYPAHVVSIDEVNVVPQVSGEILKVCFRNGDRVRAGDVLYRIDPVKYIAAEKNAAAKVEEIKSNLGYAHTQTERYGELVKTRAVPQDDLDRVRSVHSAYLASLAAAEADLVAASDDVKHCTITAPIDGRVGSTLMTEGNFVTRGGATLVKLVRTNAVRASFEIPSVDYAAAFGGSPQDLIANGLVRIARVTGGEMIVSGRVEYVENVANASTDSVKVFARLPNASERLLAGQTVMATLSRANGTLCAAVPPNAVALDLRGTYVWVLGADGRAEQRRVTRGRLQGADQLIRSGLAIGERIVIDGVHRVKSGDAVVAEK